MRDVANLKALVMKICVFNTKSPWMALFLSNYFVNQSGLLLLLFNIFCYSKVCVVIPYHENHFHNG